MIGLNKINLQNEESEYFLYSVYEIDENLFHLSLISFEDDKYFKAVLEEEYMRDKALKLRIPYEDYLNETKSALCFVPSDLKFVYDVRKDSKNFMFEWKKLIEEEELKILYGSVVLYVLNMKDIFKSILESFIVKMTNIHNEIAQMKEKVHQLSKDKSETIDLLEQTAEWKQNLEKDLYTKFILVLNSKKEKIRELESQLEETKINNSGQIPGKSADSKNEISKEEKDSLSNVSCEESFTKLIPKRKGRFISKSKVTKSKDLTEASTSTSGQLHNKCRKTETTTSYFNEREYDSDELFDEL